MKKGVKLIFLAALMAIMEHSIAQNADMTGSVANSNQAGNSPTDFSTGTISPSIQLSSIHKGNVGASLGLAYTSSTGVRVNEYAGYVGLGWNLTGIGVINRQVRGKRDEKRFGVKDFTTDNNSTRGWLDPIQLSSYETQSGLLWAAQNNTSNPTVASLVEFDYNNQTQPSNFTQGSSEWTRSKKYFYYGVSHNDEDSINLDSEPDLFSFSFNGYSGSFVFDQNGVPVLLSNQDIKIEPAIGPNASSYDGVNSWVFTTNDGTKYIFNNTSTFYEVTKTVSPTGSPNIASTPTNESVSIDQNITSWFISKIIGINGDEIDFTYNAGNLVEYTSPFEVKSNFVGDIINGGANANTTPTIPDQNSKAHTYINTPLYLSQISSSSGKIELIYDQSFIRTDVPNQFPLKYIRTYNASNTINSELEFHYSYFPTINSNPESNRLKLINISINPIGSTDKPRIYRFKYNQQVNLPERGNKNQDLWGYYNTNSSGTLIPPALLGDPSFYASVTNFSGGNRNPDPTRSQANILTQIFYPAGGSTEYQYEQNDYYDLASNSNKLTGGVRIHKIILHDKLDESKNIVTEYKYVQEGDPNKSSGEISYSTDELYKKCRYFGFTCPLMQQLSSSNAIQYEYNFITRSSNPGFMHSVDYLRYTRVEESKPGSGKTIYELSGFTSNPDVLPQTRSFTYEASGYWTITDILNSGEIQGNYIDRSVERGLVLKVKTYAENGNLLQEVSNQYELNPTIFNSRSIKAMSVFTDNYFFNMDELGWMESYEMEYYTINSRWIYLKSSESKVYSTASSSPLVSTENYYYDNADHALLSRVVSTNSKGDAIETKNTYSKDFNLSSANSNYANWSDKTAAAIAYMQQKHWDQALIATFQRKTPAGGGASTILSSNINTYLIDQASSKLYLDATFSLSSKVPISAGGFVEANVSIGGSGDGLFNADWNSHLKVFQTDKFNTTSNKLIQSHGLDGRPNSSQWNSNSTQVLAEFKNARYSPDQVGDECSYEGFEDNSNTENWSSNWVNRITSEKHTGAQAYPVVYNSSSLEKQFLPTNQYQKFKISAWVKTQAGFHSYGYLKIFSKADGASNTTYPNVPEASKVLYFQDTNGEWKYVECTIDMALVRNQAAFSTDYNINPRLRLRCTITNGDNTHTFWVDDIRFQPVLSECSNSVCDPNTGNTTSVSDNRSIPQYYSYDGLGRVLSVSNSKREIVKAYQYSDNLNAFCNSSISSSIARNNCPASNYSYGTYTYVVDECVVSSLVSQADADQQAQVLLNSEGQIQANNNCTCTTCSEEDKKIINGVCYQGTYVFDFMTPCTVSGVSDNYYQVHYHYHYSVDNSDVYLVSDCILFNNTLVSAPFQQ